MSGALAPGLERKVKKILETKLDNPELTKSLAELSTFYVENTASNRRGLRTTIEKRGLRINEEFLQVAEAAQAALEVVERELEGLASCCNRIGESLEASRACTGELVGETAKLRKELAVCDKRSHLVHSFLEGYQLSNEEVLALREGDVDDSFFNALEHVKDIHKNCKMLLRTHHQRAGLELMDVMAMHQESAYERLCRWVQSECKALGEQEEAAEVGEQLQRASRALRGRPVLLKYCTEEVASQRHNALFKRFIAALTRGGPGGMPRPMEMHAHDPRRYVGDMLAWLHQSLASEHEMLSSLFGPNTAGDEKSGAGQELVAVDGVEADKETWDIPTILDRVFEGVCRPFKVRVEQVLSSVPSGASPSLLLLFRLGVLLMFYLDTMSPHFLSDHAALTSALKECRDLAQRTLYDMIKAKGDKLLRHPPMPDTSLAPPAACSTSVSLLLDLLQCPDISMIPHPIQDSTPQEEDDLHHHALHFNPILAAILDPLLEMCSRSAEMLRESSASEAGGGQQALQPPSSAASTGGGVGGGGGGGGGRSQLPPWAPAVFLLNCLHSVQQPLLSFQAAAPKCSQLGDQIQHTLNDMLNSEAQRFLVSCELADKLELMKMYTQANHATNQVGLMSEDPALALGSVAGGLNTLFTRLSDPDQEGALPEFEQLQAPKLRLRATSELVTLLVEAYEFVYNCLLDPRYGYGDAKNEVRHTPAEVRTICGL